MNELKEMLILKLYESEGNLKETIKSYDETNAESLKIFGEHEETGNKAKCRDAFMKLMFITPMLKMSKLQNSEEDIKTFSDELIKVAKNLIK